MSNKIDVLVACVDHRLQYVVKVIYVSILVNVKMAGLRTANSVRSNAVPKGRTNYYLLLLLKLAKTTGDNERVSTAGGVARVVLKRSDRNYERHLSIHSILDFII
jgi:hypothetical protein